MVKLGEVVMILDLHRQGLTVSAIARELGIDRKTIRKCIARGLEPPVYGPRKPRKRLIDPFVQYLRERVTAYPGLTGRRLLRELRERGYEGGYTAVTDVLHEIRPASLPAFEIRFETPPGDQAQVDFARFQLQLTDEPAITRIVWLFSFVLGFSRLIWARFVLHQDMQTVLRCHMAAFNAIGGIPSEILYDRMKTAVIGEAGGSIVYNRALIDFARHYYKTLAGFDFSFQPSLDRNRILALAQLDFVDRNEVIYFLGPPGTGKSHLATALGVEAVKAGRSVYFASLADIISALAKAEREGQLRERIRFLCRTSLLIVDEIGYLPVIPGGGNLFFQLVNARYERGAMILTSNRGFAEWGEVFGDSVVATALLRSHAGARSIQSHHQRANPGTFATPPRTAAKKWSP